MKVGTDALLLGSLVDSENPKTILDIGTGCGILALMMAQKYPNSTITGIDIHNASVIEAQENVLHSPFSNINVKEIALQDLVLDKLTGFDLIISNPPFFQDDLKSACENRNYARHNDDLPFSELIEHGNRLLSENGQFWFILPYRYDKEISALTIKYGLYINEIVKLKNDYCKTPVRLVYCLTKKESNCNCRSMNIRVQRKYSSEYIELTKEFHDRPL